MVMKKNVDYTKDQELETFCQFCMNETHITAQRKTRSLMRELLLHRNWNSIMYLQIYLMYKDQLCISTMYTSTIFDMYSNTCLSLEKNSAKHHNSDFVILQFFFICQGFPRCGCFSCVASVQHCLKELLIALKYVSSNWPCQKGLSYTNTCMFSECSSLLCIFLMCFFKVDLPERAFPH